MKKLILISITILSNLGLLAQQDPMFSQYMFNYMIVNPAYVGSRDVLSVSSLFRKQWVNVDGAPQTMYLSADMPIKNEKIGVGLALANDKIGVENNTTISGMGSYRVRLSNDLLLSFGLSASTNVYKAAYSDLQSAKTGDPSLNNNVYTKWQFNFGSGIYLNNDKFYVSLSLPHMINNQRIKTDTLSNTKQKRHFFLGAGYVLKISDVLALKPSFLYKYANGAPMQLDLNANLWYANLVGFGLSYRTGDAFVPMFEINPIEQLRIGYAYDYTYNLKRIGVSNGGSHELFLRYEFGKNDKKMITPRYF